MTTYRRNRRSLLHYRLRRIRHYCDLLLEARR